MHGPPLLRVALLLTLPLAPVRAQQPNPFGGGQVDTGKTQSQQAGIDSVQPSGKGPAGHGVPAGFKAGLFGFAGHSHVIRARAFSGEVVYYPHAPARSHLQMVVSADNLEVLTPPDTAEIRKVTAAMRVEVLHTDQYHEIRLASKKVAPTADGFHIVAAASIRGLTLCGRKGPSPSSRRISGSSPTVAGRQAPSRSRIGSPSASMLSRPALRR